MYKALKEKHDVTMISYKKQYPKLIFKKEQRDYRNESFKVDEKDLLQVRTNAKYVVTPHPTYDVFNMSNMSKDVVREVLEVKKEIWEKIKRIEELVKNK